MKKWLILMVSLFAMIVLVACGTSNSQSGQASSSTNENSGQSGRKVLVAYFSATGSTADVAKEIASKTGGNLFEITPRNPYSRDDLDWNDPNSRVVSEYENPSRRDISLQVTTPENWSDYDTIFIGYPIWWQDAAWPINNFVKNNDFSGKTVIPFTTSLSSGLGNSGSNLAKMAGTGDWQTGQRFSSSASTSQVDDWLKELGY